MKHDYSVIILWSNEDEAYLAEVPELPGCMADGATQAEALRNAQEAAAKWVEVAREESRPVPHPLTTEDWEKKHQEFQNHLQKHIQKEVAGAVQKIIGQMLESQMGSVFLCNPLASGRISFPNRIQAPAKRELA